MSHIPGWRDTTWFHWFLYLCAYPTTPCRGFCPFYVGDCAAEYFLSFSRVVCREDPWMEFFMFWRRKLVTILWWCHSFLLLLWKFLI